MLKSSVFALMLAAAPLALTAAPAHAANVQLNTNSALVELSVSEEVMGAPDMATLGTGVTTRAMTAKEALRANSAEMDRLIARIKAMGIPAKDIQTSGININAQYDYQNNERKFLGYDVTNNVTVKARDLKNLGGLIDAMVDAGANNLSGPWFTVEKDDALKQAAREKALNRAEALASFYARKAGYSSVRILTVNEGISGRGGPVPMMVMAKVEMADVASAPVEPGQVGVSVNLSITYEMVR